MKHELLALETSSDIVSFSKLFGIIYRMKWFILFTTLSFAATSVYIVNNMPNVYTVKGLFVPTESKSSGGLSQLAGQFGGLASMAGISLGGGQKDETAIAIELLQSRSFLQGFIEKHNLLPQLLAAKSWNSETGDLIFDEAIYSIKDQEWVRGAPPGKQIIPTPWEGFDKLFSAIKVNNMPKKGLVEISVTFLSPEVATQWLTLLVADLNSYLRLQDKKQAQDSIAYLQEQAEQTNNSEMQTIFYSIIAEQTKTMLLTEVRKEYLFKTLAPIVVPEQKSAPSRALLCAVVTFFGGLLSLVISFIYASARPEKK